MYFDNSFRTRWFFILFHFINLGGLLMICDRISRNAESLEWSYGRKAGRSTVQTVLRRELIGSKPIEETEDWDESLLENFAPCS